MTLRSYLGLSCALLALPACILDAGLGETAEGGSGDGSGSEGTSGSGTSSDPSATSGMPGTATEDPPGTSGDGSSGDDSSGTGSEPGCEPGEEWVVWADEFPEPIPGIEATTAILEGPCSLDGTFSSIGPGSAEWEIYLACTMSGRVDGDPNVVDQAFFPVLHGFSASPLEQWLPFFETDLRLRLMVDWWGMGTNRYAVLYSGDTVMLDMVAAEYVDPRDGPFWQDDLDTVLGGEPWHDEITVGITESSCGTSIGMCGEDPRAIELGWSGAGLPLVLHDDQQGSFDTLEPGLTYEAWVESAADISTPTCTDTPLGDYRFSIWASLP